MHSRSFRLLLSLLLVAGLLLSCGVFALADGEKSASVTRSVTQPMGPDGWTILVYLCGSDLETDGGSATDDMLEMLDATASGQVRVVIQTGGAEEWQNNTVSDSASERYLVENGELTRVASFARANMGDSQTLADFVTWGVQNYGAAHMGLVLWNHGSGSISGVCFDEISDYESLTLRDIDTALSSASAVMTDRFEFVGFDACLMATLETANMLVPYARYLYASEETEPSTGWDYTSLLNFLAWNPNADGAALGQIVAQSYYTSCQDTRDPDNITFSIVNLDKLDALLVAFDRTAQELYESGNLTDFARGAISADNFGGNSRAEGYTNMVDLAGMLRNCSSLAPSASEALSALSDAVVCMINGQRHSEAGGLSLYYPLSVQGSSELSTFRDVCPSTYYLALVDKLAYGSTGADTSSYDNSGIITGSGHSFIDYLTGNTSGGSADAGYAESAEALGGSSGTPSSSSEEDCPLDIDDVYLDQDGNYIVSFNSMDNFAYGSCTVYWEYYLDDSQSQWWDIYLGEDDDVLTDYDNLYVTDDFDGQWLWMGETLLPIELVAQYDTESLYNVEIYLNGEQTNLQIRYDWESGEFTVLGTWAGIDPDTGMAARDTTPLQIGDQIQVIYNYIDEYGDMDTFTLDTITYDGNLSLEYDMLPSGEYDYCINLYDIYGNCWQAGSVLFGIEDDGSLYFYES